MINPYWSYWISSICGVGCLVAGLLMPQAFADDFHPLYQGARALGMGNAFTAVADDEQAIFYNPAGLAGIQQISLHGLTSDIQVSNDAVTSFPELSRALSNAGVSSVNTLMKKNLYLKVQESSTLVFPGFGIAALLDQQLAIRLKNQTFPNGIIGSQRTYGVQTAFGFTLVKFKRKRGELRFGVAAKFLQRSGGYQNVGLTQLLTLDSKAIMDNINGPAGSGVGADSGVQLVYNLKKGITLLSGLSFTDMGRTSFSSGAAPQLSNLTFGLAARYKNSNFSTTLSYDYSHILDYSDWKKKNHVGLELKFPGLSLYGGLNQIYPTYGAAVDLWLVNLKYVSYGEEQATLASQDPERRHLIHVSFKLDL